MIRIKICFNMTFIRLALPLKKVFLASAFCLQTTLAMTSQLAAETIALSLPISGEFSEIGRDFSTGAKLAMDKLGNGHQLFIADDGCDTDLANFAAQEILSQKPAIVTGILCNDIALSHANTLRESGMPLVIAGARSIRLTKDRDREDWNIWQIPPTDLASADTISKYVTNNLKDKAFALVDDGTIFGRSMTDAIRLRLNEARIEPQFSDSFRAAQSTQSGLLRRLQRSGISVAIISAATQDDLVTIAKDTKRLGLEIELVMSEQLAVLPFLEENHSVPDNLKVIMQTVPVSLETAAELTAQLKELDIAPTRAIYEGYAAIQVALSALGKSYAETAHNLSTNEHQTVLGSVKFDQNGKNIENPYRLHSWQDGTLKPLKADNNNL